ncbi:uncharacterized protein LOC127378158 isoform X3 [Dicentrarchus labrax]|uniref:uncharacterized protein LOC127378158 isoform X3 n=1 Tax=Dicentrarchus labrax TaxID=13489 RepID=UPI0021F688DF|nr:uncharacterized protein LOC127378158 isoform X3 [Dicentrarchus labrax]
MSHFRNFVFSFWFLFWTWTVCLTEGVWTSDGGQPRVVGSFQPIVTVLGDDVILPCRLQPSLNVERLTVEWSRPDLKPDPSDRLGRVNYVHLHRGGHDNLDMKLRSYVGRTELSKDGLKSGDISLKILNVTLEDGGRYRCLIPKLKGPVKESVVTLVVGQPRVVGSLQPVVTHIGDDVILPCRLQPSLNVERLTVEWSRPDLKPDPSDWLTPIVHLHRGGHENTDMKLRSYIGRTELSKDGLKSGDISLKILNVTLEDGGRYRCFIPKLKGPVKESVVTLVVVFSEPISVQTTIETQLDARQIKNPDPRIPIGRSHLGILIVVVVCVLLVLGGGVGGYLLKHKKPQKLLGYEFYQNKPSPV